MVEIRVNIGTFDLTLEQLIDLKEGQVFRWKIPQNETLELLVGDEKIAEACLVTKGDELYLQLIEVV